MTTIATDGKSMAADRLVTSDTAIHGVTTKIVQLDDGTIIGHTGNAYQFESFVTWYKMHRPEPFDCRDDMEALVLTPDGVIRCYDQYGRSYVADAPQATGSGCRVAIGAMAAGATPAEAVEIASRYDTKTGGGVDSYTLP